MENISDEISKIPKGSKSLIAAFKELELVKKAFEHNSRIEKKMQEYENSIEEMRSRMLLLSTSSYVDVKSENLRSSIDTLVKSKVDEYMSHVFFELNQKITEKDTKKLLDLKVNWASFIDLKNLYSSTRLKLDSHIDVEFENYKIKQTEEFKSYQRQITENRRYAEIAIDELMEKFKVLEAKVQEILDDDEESVKDNKSEVDFDKMMGDLEKNLTGGRFTEKIINLRPIDSGFDESSIRSSQGKPHNLTQPPSKVEIPIRTQQRRLSNPKNASSQLIINIPPKNQTEINDKTKEQPISLTSQRKSKINEPNSPLTGFAEQGWPQRTPSDHFGGAYSPTYRKDYQEPFSRRNSVASPKSGGIRQISKKVLVFEKDISELFEEIRSSKKIDTKIHEEIRKIYEKIEAVNKRCDLIEDFEKKMENEFVYRLRVKDMQNTLKKDKVIVEKVPGEDVTRLANDINEKNKRIVQIDNYLKYLMTELEYVKKKQSTTFRGFQESLESIERDKLHKDKELESLKSNFSQIELGLAENLSKICEDTSGRFTASDSLREKGSGLAIRRRSQEIYKITKEDSSSMASVDRGVINKPLKKPTVVPRVNLKQKLL